MIHIKSYESVIMILVTPIDEDEGMMFRMFLLQKPEGESRLLSWFERCRQYHVSSRLKSNCINISNPFHVFGNHENRVDARNPLPQAHSDGLHAESLCTGS